MKNKEFNENLKNVNHWLDLSKLSRSVNLTDVQVLKILNHKDMNNAVLDNLADNYNLSQTAYENILNHKDANKWTLCLLARNPSLTERFYNKLLKNKNFTIKCGMYLAQNNKNNKILNKILKYQWCDENVLALLYKNPALSKHSVIKVFQHKKANEYFNRAILKNYNPLSYFDPIAMIRKQQ